LHHPWTSLSVGIPLLRQSKLDNTLIIYIAGDNGNSAEGTLVGTPNETASLQAWFFRSLIR
jgi:hypothetical protein